jgi:hypothetical protein
MRTARWLGAARSGGYVIKRYASSSTSLALRANKLDDKSFQTRLISISHFLHT